MRYTLDTNVLLFYVRDKRTRQFIEDNYAPFGAANTAIISVVSVAEIYSLATKHQWGSTKRRAIEQLIEDLIVVEVRYQDLIDAYVELETYSNKSHPIKSKLGSAVKMGKNDLWIAATASVTQSKLITSDGDFDHLNDEYFEVIKYRNQDSITP